MCKLVLDMPIDDLEFSVRTYNCLRRGGVNTVQDIANMTYEELAKIRNMSRKSLYEISETMSKRFGIVIEPTVPEIQSVQEIPRKRSFYEIMNFPKELWKDFTLELIVRLGSSNDVAFAKQVEFFLTFKKKVERDEYDTKQAARAVFAFHLGQLSALIYDRNYISLNQSIEKMVELLNSLEEI